MAELKKVPIGLLIGQGSRIGLLLQQFQKNLLPVEIVFVVSHKAMRLNKKGEKQDVFGIKLAKKLGIKTAYFNKFQMREAAKEKQKEKFNNKKFEGNYFEVLGQFLSQNYPIKPQGVFCFGWDLIVPENFLEYFPGKKKGEYEVINIHPSLLADNPKDKFFVLQKVKKGTKIPVIKGLEHDDVLRLAFELKLPALGATMHYVVPDADSGKVIQRVEVPILNGDTIESYDERLKIAEEKLIVDVVKSWAKEQLKNGR